MLGLMLWPLFVDLYYSSCTVKEQSLLIQGTEAEDFWQGYETFFHKFVALRKLERNLYGVIWGTKLLCLNEF